MSETTSLPPIPIPSLSGPTARQATSVVLLDDENALAALIDQLLMRSGLSQREVCRRLGISESNFNQYRLKRRVKPSVWWLNRLAQVCGARLLIEWPKQLG